MTTLENLLVRRHELDQQLAAAQVKADVSNYSELMRQRNALQADADADMEKLYIAKNQAFTKLQEAQHKADLLGVESRKTALAYQNAAPRWADKLAQADQLIRDSRPAELGQFVDWITAYHGQLTGYTTHGYSFNGQNLVPMVTQAGQATVVNRPAFDRTIELLRTSKDEALALGATVEPGEFMGALDKLRADTEEELESLRLGYSGKRQGRK